jgi:hypothetical protein
LGGDPRGHKRRVEGETEIGQKPLKLVPQFMEFTAARRLRNKPACESPIWGPSWKSFEAEERVCHFPAQRSGTFRRTPAACVTGGHLLPL